MTLKECIDYLRDNKYLLYSAGKLSLSKTFQEHANALRNGVNLPPSLSDTSLVPVGGDGNWEARFIKFIQEAKVPKTLENANLESYAANKYSVEAMKIFKKAIENGAIYETLVRSTQLYYASKIRYKKAVGNYFIQGDWKTDYIAMAEKMEGTKEDMIKHIEEETKDDSNYTPYRF